jgi:hypothetical protein
MSDEQENVDAGSETSGEQAAAETSQEETAAAETTDVSTEKSEETAADAGSAAEPTPETEAPAPNADASRTDFAAKGLHAGDECICPDGRKGTVHSFDAGLICIPNADQG